MCVVAELDHHVVDAMCANVTKQLHHQYWAVQQPGMCVVVMCLCVYGAPYTAHVPDMCAASVCGMRVVVQQTCSDQRVHHDPLHALTHMPSPCQCWQMSRGHVINQHVIASGGWIVHSIVHHMAITQVVLQHCTPRSTCTTYTIPCV